MTEKSSLPSPPKMDWQITRLCQYIVPLMVLCGLEGSGTVFLVTTEESSSTSPPKMDWRVTKSGPSIVARMESYGLGREVVFPATMDKSLSTSPKRTD